MKFREIEKSRLFVFVVLMPIWLPLLVGLLSFHIAKCIFVDHFPDCHERFP